MRIQDPTRRVDEDFLGQGGRGNCLVEARFFFHFSQQNLKAEDFIYLRDFLKTLKRKNSFLKKSQRQVG